MRITLSLISMMFLLGSCATILNRKTTALEITSNEAAAGVAINDSIYPLPAKVRVLRSNKDLPLRLLVSNQEIEYRIKPSPSLVFLLGNIYAVHFSPLAYGIDFTNHKRFDYGFKIHLNTADTQRILVPPIRDYFTRKYPNRKGVVRLQVGMPYINHFSFRNTPDRRTNKNGFLGFGLGVDYFHQSKQYLHLEASTAIDFLAPVPAPVHYWGGVIPFLKSRQISLSNNHQIGRLNLGYGLAYARNVTEFKDFGDTARAPNSGHIVGKALSHNIGFYLPVYYQLGRHFNLGVSYRPSFLQVAPRLKFNYEHMVSLNVVWKFRIIK